MYSRQAVPSTAPFQSKGSWNTHTKITVTCSEPSVPIIANLYDPKGICVTFSWSASSRCWCVSINGAESSSERKSIAECRLRPVRTSVSKYAIIAALERKPWRRLGHITREMGMSEQMILGTLHKITCLRTTTNGSHTCFQTIAYYNCSFSYDCVINVMRVSSFSSHILWTDVACFRVKVCCPSTAVTCASGIFLLPFADNVADMVAPVCHQTD